MNRSPGHTWLVIAGEKPSSWRLPLVKVHVGVCIGIALHGGIPTYWARALFFSNSLPTFSETFRVHDFISAPATV
jgi:hypothetical protein